LVPHFGAVSIQVHRWLWEFLDQIELWCIRHIAIRAISACQNLEVRRRALPPHKSSLTFSK
ncbi:hypothetical protein ACM7KY_31805, partial [Pseudomonas aeruginosa]